MLSCDDGCEEKRGDMIVIAIMIMLINNTETPTKIYICTKNPPRCAEQGGRRVRARDIENVHPSTLHSTTPQKVQR